MLHGSRSSSPRSRHQPSNVKFSGLSMVVAKAKDFRKTPRGMSCQKRIG
jgi:hypothetical protein